jgi:NTE family protein
VPKKLPNITKAKMIETSKINSRIKNQDLQLLVLQVLILVFIFFIGSIHSQETPRKKIGLVLSGGGAKGFAHIGVLKVLEQAGVKIDYIGGTSMGSVVGGLYAVGYSATQIDSIFKATDYEALLNDIVPRGSKNFFEKQNDEQYAFTLPFSGFKIKIPISLSKGLYNYNSFNQLFKNQRDIRDFSKLPIPFLCIATDIETGQEILLNKGYLPQVILASSAFPSLFAPVEIDNKLLVDGGVANNYPIEHVRAMGADIIIGVDVQDDLKKRADLKEATRILVQITNLQMVEDMKQKSLKTDFYIKPDVTQYGIISFADQSKIIKKGEEAALVFFEQFKNLAGASYQVQQLKKSKDTLVVDIITINELQNYSRAYVIGKLGFTEKQTISYDDLKVGINKLNATQNFSTINYEIIKNAVNQNEILLNLVENSTKTFMKFGLHYDGLYKTGVLTNLTNKRNFFKNDVVSLDLVLGDNFRYNFDYYIDNGFYWSFGLKSRFKSFNRNVATDFNNGELLSQLALKSININFSDHSQQVFVQTVFRQKFQIGLGLEFKYLRLSSETLANSVAVFEKSNYFSAFGSIKYDSYDNKFFPTKGVYLSGDFQTYLFSSNFTGDFNPFSIARAEVGFTKKFLKKISFKSQTEAGLAIGAQSVPFFNFVLGGYGFQPINNFKHFYGYDFLSLSGNSFIKTTGTFDYEFYKKNHINFSANYAYLQDRLFETTQWISAPRLSGYAVGYGFESIVGPIEFKQSYSPETGNSFSWISVGFWF